MMVESANLENKIISLNNFSDNLRNIQFKTELILIKLDYKSNVLKKLLNSIIMNSIFRSVHDSIYFLPTCIVSELRELGTKATLVPATYIKLILIK